MSAPSSVAAILAVAMAMAALATAQQCGSQAGGETCPNCLFCSTYGYCGSDPAYCGAGCQSQCSGCSSGPGSGVASIVSRDLFERFLLHQNNAACLARGFYTYDAFLAAAAAYPAFGTTGDLDTRKPEVAAFFGQTSHETTGGWPTAPDGTYSWGYCFKQEQGSPGSPPADLLRLQARMAMRARQAVLRLRPHPAHPQLQLRTGRARNWSGPTEQPGPGGDRPDSVVQDGDLVLDDDAVGQAIVPRRDHGTVDSNG